MAHEVLLNMKALQFCDLRQSIPQNILEMPSMPFGLRASDMLSHGRNWLDESRSFDGITDGNKKDTNMLGDFIVFVDVLSTSECKSETMNL